LSTSEDSTSKRRTVRDRLDVVEGEPAREHAQPPQLGLFGGW
jgi:hypothetical protein